MHHETLDTYIKIVVFGIIILLSTERCYSRRRQCHDDTHMQKLLDYICSLADDYSNESICTPPPVQGPLHYIPDTPVAGPQVTNRSILTLPEGLSVRPSSILDAGMGVFADRFIPAMTLFGPYVGVIINDNDTGFLYAWTIFKDEEMSHYIDGEDESRSNWLRFVNSPHYEEDQNVEAAQMKGEIYYKTLVDIPECTELLVWYGDEYGEYLEGLRAEKEEYGGVEREERWALDRQEEDEKLLNEVEENKAKLIKIREAAEKRKEDAEQRKQDTENIKAAAEKRKRDAQKIKEAAEKRKEKLSQNEEVQRIAEKLQQHKEKQRDAHESKYFDDIMNDELERMKEMGIDLLRNENNLSDENEEHTSITDNKLKDNLGTKHIDEEQILNDNSHTEL